MKRVLIVVVCVVFVLAGCATLQEAEAEKNNTDTIKQAYAYFGQGDVPGFLGMLSADCEIILPGAPEYVPWGGTYTGPDGFVQFFTVLSEYAEIYGAEYFEFIAQGNKVVVPFEEQKRAKADGNEFINEGIAVWTVRDGTIVGVRFYADTAHIAANLGTIQ